MIVRVTTVYHDENGMQHTMELSRPMFTERLINADKINWEGVSHAVALYDFTTKARTVIQTGGFTPDRGLFIDQY